jgi:NitT/TauT family transport system substrate-binding protein
MLARRSLAVVFALAAVAAATTAKAQDIVNLRLNWYLGGSHAAFYLGRDLGFFADENIDIQIDEGRGSGRSVQLVGTGTDDFAMADAGSLMVGVSKGLEAVSILSLVNISTFAIVALEDSGIASPKDLEGKTVAVTAGDALTQLWPAVVAANNLNADAIKLVMMDPAAKPISVMEGQTDALLGGISDQPNLIRKHGHEVTVIPFYEIGVNTIGMTLITHPDMIAEQADLVGRFVRATQKSYQAMLDDPDAAVAAVKAEKADLDEATLRSQIIDTNDMIQRGLPADQPFGYNPPEVWQQTLDIMKTYRGLETDEPATAFYTNAFITD